MNIAKFLRLAAVIILCCFASSVLAAGGGDAVSAPAGLQVQELQGKIMNDPGIMALISALQADPEVRGLLSDPRVLQAVQSGDYGALLDDPRIQKLMNGPQVREIEKRLQAKKPGEGT
jgi:hypothetical protein